MKATAKAKIDPNIDAGEDLVLLAYELGRRQLHDQGYGSGSFMDMLDFIPRAAKIFTHQSRQIKNVWEEHVWDDAVEDYADAITEQMKEADIPTSALLAQMARRAINKS